MKILFCAGEASPFIKVGGLGDVAGALPKALNGIGNDCRVVIPMYSAMKYREKCKPLTEFYIDNSWRHQYVGIFTCEVGNTTYYLIDNKQYFDRPQIYGEFDDGERMAFFSRAVLEMLPHIGFTPDVIHCNDWHTALVPVLLNLQFRDRYPDIRTLFTIHNIEFQGKFDPYILGSVFGLPERDKNVMFYGDCLNLVKGAIETADKITTVSPTYADEILSPRYSYGLDAILNARKYKLSGIVNGIDTDSFDPATDPDIKVHYSAEKRGLKYHDKFALEDECGLPRGKDIPLFAMVTRLTHQKGLDLVLARLDWLTAQDIQLVILGTGDSYYENALRAHAAAHPDKMAVITQFDGKLARRIYAGADFFLMPSEYEPCGLSQMMAMRYGTVPIVRKTGGLADTVIPFDVTTGKGNGLDFVQFNADDMANAVWRATELFRDKQNFSRVRKNAMECDFSWDNSARQYDTLYKEITEKK